MIDSEKMFHSKDAIRFTKKLLFLFQKVLFLESHMHVVSFEDSVMILEQL